MRCLQRRCHICICYSKCVACQDDAVHFDIKMRCLLRQIYSCRSLVHITLNPPSIIGVTQVFGFIQPCQNVTAQVSDLARFSFQQVIYIVNIHLIQRPESAAHFLPGNCFTGNSHRRSWTAKSVHNHINGQIFGTINILRSRLPQKKATSTHCGI